MGKKKSKSKVYYLPNSFHQNFSGYQTDFMIINGYQTNLMTKTEIQKLKSNSNPKGGNTVSDFTSWIYDSIIPEKKPIQNLEFGKKGENKVLEEIIDEIDKSDNYFKRHYQSFLDDDWVLEFEDLSHSQKEVFKISSLRFNGGAIYGKPDIVYRNRRNNDRIIVEVKTTGSNTNIPHGGWYNLQCQLWSYAHIDNFKDSSNIFLMGDIRLRRFVNRTTYYNHGRKVETPSHYSYTHSGISPRWRFIKEGKINSAHKEVDMFHQQCKMIFELYGGEYIQSFS